MYTHVCIHISLFLERLSLRGSPQDGLKSAGNDFAGVSYFPVRGRTWSVLSLRKM